MKAHPDIEVKFLPPAQDYAPLLAENILQAITGTLPDVAFEGLSNVGALQARGLLQPMDKFVAATQAPAGGKAYRPATLGLGRIAGKQFAIPVAVSLPTIYYNADLVRQAGGDPDHLIQDWNGIFALATKIAALPSHPTGLWFRCSTDSWYWQTLVGTFGGNQLDASETHVAFTGPEGQKAAQILGRAASETHMPDLSYAQAQQTFMAGAMGIQLSSSSLIGTYLRQLHGRFDMRTAFPLSSPHAMLSAGGNAAVMFAKNPAAQGAAWEYIAFATGPVAQTIMVKATGYMPTSEQAVDDPQYLGAYYQQNPSYLTPICQLNWMVGWFGFPGANRLKINQVIANGMERIYTGRMTPDAGLKLMADQTQALLPQK